MGKGCSVHEVELYEGKIIANILKKTIFESTFSELIYLMQQCFFQLFCFLLVTSGMLAQC